MEKVKEFLDLCTCHCGNNGRHYPKDQVIMAGRKFTVCLPAILNGSLNKSKTADDVVNVCNELYCCLQHKLMNNGKNKADSTSELINVVLYTCCATLTLLDFQISPEKSMSTLIQCFVTSVLDCLKLVKRLSIDPKFKLLSEYLRAIIMTSTQILLWEVDSSLWCEIRSCDKSLPSFEAIKDLMERAQKNLKEKSRKGLRKDGVLDTSAGNRSGNTLSTPCSLKSLAQATTSTPQEFKVQTIHIKEHKTVWKPSVMSAFLETYNYAYLRLKDLCEVLVVSDYLQDMWTAFNHALTNHCREILLGRHLDQVILCIVYAVCKAKVTVQPLEFKTILRCYKKLPNSDPNIHKCVSLSPCSATKYVDTGEVSPDANKIEKSIPVKISNPQNDKDTKGDLIAFYNRIFLPIMKSYFKSNLNLSKELPGSAKHSPVPTHRDSPIRVSNNVYISPLRNGLPSPPRCMEYKFSSSPGSQLRNINEMLRNSPVAKRPVAASDDNPGGTKCAKKISFSTDDVASSTNSRNSLLR